MPRRAEVFRSHPVCSRDWRADRASRATDPAQAEASRIRSGKQWQALRAACLAAHPLCCDPLGYHASSPALAGSIHHIKPLHLRPDLAYEVTNLASLCRPCHDRIEAMLRRGEPTEGLFVGKTCKINL
jgi:5-methylcytosine-specific restriction enzyme A